MSHRYQEQEVDEEFNRRARDKFFITDRVLLTAMLLFFLVTMLLLFLYIYVWCIIQRQASRRAAILQLSTVTVSVVHVHQPVDTHGLDPMVIARLPIFLYKRPELDQQQTDLKVANNSVEECSVCLSFLEEEEIVRVLPNCKHTFHAKCIDLWLLANHTCPICRTNAQPRVPEEPGSKSEDDQYMV